MDYKDFYEMFNSYPNPKFKYNLLNSTYFEKKADYFRPNIRETKRKLITQMPINRLKSIDTARIVLPPVSKMQSETANINNIYLK